MSNKRTTYILPKDHQITITFFDVGGGDAIWIRYLGDDSRWHNILIDGGYGKSYKSAFGPLISRIGSSGEQIDLWVITHIDLDHIGAILGFIQDNEIPDRHAVIAKYWFNHAQFSVPSTDSKIGYRQGMQLREYLRQLGKLDVTPITVDTLPQDFYGLVLTVLSPTNEKLSNANLDWSSREGHGKIGRAADKADHHTKIEDFVNTECDEDTDPANGSSISLFVEYKNVRGLLLADSHPSDITTTLTALQYNALKPLMVDFIKVAHHGSKSNTSLSLLELAKTNIFVFCANGISNRHPDKETLTRMLLQNDRRRESLVFKFAANTPEIKNLFIVDNDPFQRHNFTCEYIEDGLNNLTLTYLPIEQLYDE